MIQIIRDMTKDQRSVVLDVAILAACAAFVAGFAMNGLLNDPPQPIAEQYTAMSAEERADFLTWATTERVQAVISISVLGLDVPVTQPRSD
jgi:hypothetical protein